MQPVTQIINKAAEQGCTIYGDKKSYYSITAENNFHHFLFKDSMFSVFKNEEPGELFFCKNQQKN